MEEGEKKSVIAQVGSWLWGTIEGGFNEKQTTSQIVVDAAISMIPLVGDATAARDLIAVILRLVREPERRKDKLEWVQLVILVFALVPVVGGAIKGIGKVIFKEGSRAAELLPKVIEALNRIGFGHAVEFVKGLELTKYEAVIRGKFAELADRLGVAIDGVLRRLSFAMPDRMIELLRWLKNGVNELRALADRMIPDALKEFQSRLKAIQAQVYQGEWHAVASSSKTTTREAEARLMEQEAPKLPAAESHLAHPHDGISDFAPVPGWPDLSDASVYGTKKTIEYIGGFSGPIRAVKLEAGEKIYRVVQKGSAKSGFWWTRTLPKNGKTWRKDLAVLDSWSQDGYFIEFIVPQGGLWVWEGKAATQVETVAAATMGQHLEGGGQQLFIDFMTFEPHREAAALVEALPLKETHWIDHMGVNVPASEVSVQRLGEHELEPKTMAAPRAAGAAARAVRSQDQASASP